MYDNSQAEFEKILRKYGDSIYRIALVHTQNEMDAQDVVQEVFLKFARNASQFQSDEHIKAWLIRVAINMCTDLKRSAWNRKTTELNDECLPAEEFTTGESELYQAVMSLPVKYKDVIHLFYYEGYSIKEISRITEQKENAVKTQLSRGRVLLKELLKGEYDYAL
ncbi:MAG: sigma-70 family RNA polymerase sigma factor [Oscillospiraceae bacterium]|nr:sigma-70 family RNA polymerase sigma factor [Oscillospiraceae bacterium]